MVVVLLVAPFVVSVVRAHSAGWEPSGDNGIIALQAYDTYSGHPPLVGLPSTAGLYSQSEPRHPGPIEFYALAMPMKVLGTTAGMVGWTAFANLSSVLVAAWVVFRRAGPGVGLWGAVVLGAIAWAQGPAQLADPVSSNAGGIPMVALAVLAWALASGDRRLLPLFALFSAYVSQQHLGVLGFGVALTLGGLAGLTHWGWRTRVRRRRRMVAVATASLGPASAGPPHTEPAPGPTAGTGAGGQGTRAVADREAGPNGPDGLSADGGRWWPWLGGALVVALLCWLPVLIDTLVNDPSNLSKLSNFTGTEDRQTVGAGAGLRQAVRAIGLPPLIGRTGLSGNDLVESVSVLEWVGALIVVIVLVAVVLRCWRSRPALARLSLTALCLAVTGGVIGANVPAFEADRLNLYRWAFVVSVLAWLAIGWAAGLWLVVGRHRYRVRTRWATPWPAVAAIAVISIGASTFSGPVGYRDGELFRIERRLNDRVLEAVEGKENVLVLPFGALASRALAQSLAVDLEAHGHRAILPGYEIASYGSHRSLAEVRPDAVVVVRSGRGSVDQREDDAEVLFTEDLNPDRRDLYEQLVQQARSASVVVSPGGAEMARTAGLDPELTDAAFQFLSVDPDSIFYETRLLDLLAAGYLSSPKLDPGLIAELQANPLDQSWDNDLIEVVQISPALALFLYPTLPDEPTGVSQPGSTDPVPD